MVNDLVWLLVVESNLRTESLRSLQELRGNSLDEIEIMSLKGEGNHEKTRYRNNHRICWR